MKFIKATLLFLLVLLLTRELSAKERNRFLNDTTIATKRITGDEKQAIADAMIKKPVETFPFLALIILT